MWTGPRKRALIPLLGAVLTVLLLMSCSSSQVPQDEEESVYISLGDSLAVGVGSSDPTELGYAPLYRDALSRESGGEVRLIQLGIPGETSASFIGDDYPNGPSQLEDSVQAVRRNPGASVTLSLGGNDLLQAEGSSRARALAAYSQNLDYILGAFSEASEPPPRITVLALYNPAPGSFTDIWTERINDEIRTVAERKGASVAAGDQVFVGNEDEYARYSQYPGDIHPTDAGYAALARAFEEARGDDWNT
ncbi:MAG: SGNH/GDSL hydrolase family protein [Rubrobacter sp.]